MCTAVSKLKITGNSVKSSFVDVKCQCQIRKRKSWVGGEERLTVKMEDLLKGQISTRQARTVPAYKNSDYGMVV